MIRIKIGAGLREEALPILTNTIFQLLGAGGMTEVGGGTTYVVNIALKARQLGNKLCLTNDGLVAASLNDAPLMGVNGAEGAAAKAATTADDAELHLF